MFESQRGTFKAILYSYDHTEASFQQLFATLKEWIMQQSHFPEVMDDNIIRNFLLLNKCRVEKTKEKIENYYKMPSLLPDVYVHPESAEIQKSVENTYVVILPKLTKDMCRVFVMKIRRCDLVDDVQPRSVLSRALHLQEISLKEDLMFKDILIFDMEGVNWRLLLKITPNVLLKAYSVYEKVYSIRLKAVYIINGIPIIHTVLTILKKILKPKIFERIQVCEGTDILYKILSREMIPKDFGGDEKSLEELSELQNIKLAVYRDRFSELQKMKIDENRRCKKMEDDSRKCRLM